jgi:hypothetical protein
VNAWLWTVSAAGLMVILRVLATIAIEASRRKTYALILNHARSGLVWAESRPEGSLLCYADPRHVPGGLYRHMRNPPAGRGFPGCGDSRPQPGAPSVPGPPDGKSPYTRGVS